MDVSLRVLVFGCENHKYILLWISKLDRFTNFSPLSLNVAPGFELASSVHFVGAHSSRCPATTSWNYALHGCIQHARAACTRCHGWIPPWWWFTTRQRVATAALAPEGSTPCLRGRRATSRLVTQRSLDATVAVWKHKTEAHPALNPRSSVKQHFHRHAYYMITYRHVHVKNFIHMCNTLYIQTVHMVFA